MKHDEFERYIRTEERRAFPRWPVTVRGEFHGVNGKVKADVVELNELGLTLKSEHAFDLGSEVHVRCDIGLSKPIDVKAVVKQKRGNAIGAEFLNLKLADRVRIQDYFARKVTRSKPRTSA